MQLVFLGLALALVAGAAMLLVPVIFRRGRTGTYLALALLLIVLALGVWWTAIRTPLNIP